MPDVIGSTKFEDLTGVKLPAYTEGDPNVAGHVEVADLVATANPSTSVRTATGITDTLGLADSNGVVRYTNGSAVTVTIPPIATVALPVGTFIELHQAGAGKVSVAAGSGVTINVRGGLLGTAGQYAVMGLRKVLSDTWVLTGDLA